jgi:Mrp family chromosome partitioning ATPase
VVQSVAVVVGVVMLASLNQTALYQASAQVLLSQKDLASYLNNTQNPNAYVPPDRAAQTQANLARVRAVSERTIKAARVAGITAADFLASSSVTPNANADLLTFQVTIHDRHLAPRLATEYARQYKIYRRQLDTAALAQARRDIRTKISRLRSTGGTGSALYNDLASKDQQLATLEALQTSNAYVVQDAPGAAKVQPRPVRNALIALAFGLLLGVGLAFLWEALDTRVRTAEEIAEKLKLPLLARLPAPPKRLRVADQLVMLEDPDSPSAEAFRLLRTNLEFVNLEAAARTLMVTSAVEGEGKSTTAANLALALARSGRKVVLVDLDLRRPFLDHFFDLTGPGLTEVALGHVQLEQALARIPVEPTSNNGRGAGPGGKPEGSMAQELEATLERAVREGRPDLVRAVVDKATAAAQMNGSSESQVVLEVLPSGPIPPNPGEFIGMNALDEILGDLRERADIVVLDTTPILQVGDAMALSAKADALLLVTRLNMVRRPMLAELRRALESTPATVLGFVVTGGGEDGSYGYAYSSYYTATSESASARRPRGGRATASQTRGR